MTAFVARGESFSPERDGARLGKQYDRVREYVLSRDWLTLAEISNDLGYPEASVSARLRDLRARGYSVECEYVRRGLHRYRVVAPQPSQLELLTRGDSEPEPATAGIPATPEARQLRGS